MAKQYPVIDAWTREAQKAAELVDEIESRIKNKKTRKQQQQQQRLSDDIAGSKLLEVEVKLDRLDPILFICFLIIIIISFHQGSEAVECIVPYFPPDRELSLCNKSFSVMKNLRLLKIDGGSLRKIHYLSNELRLLKWSHYPLISLPSKFRPENLYKLSMCDSCVQKLWQGAQNMNHLKVIKLSRSEGLTETPDFTGVPNLERLILDGCTNLSFLHPSVGLLKGLNLLNLSDCKKLKNLPVEIEWESLEVLILSGCSELKNVKYIVGSVKHLLQLHLDGTSIQEEPPSIQYLTRLTMFNLNRCKSLVHLPGSICDLRSLKVLNLNGCSRLDSVPENLVHISSLEELDLGGCSLQAIPNDMGCLSSLEILNLSGNDFVTLPASISQLSKLETLNIECCQRLQGLSELPLSLRKLDLGGCNLQEGPILNDMGCLSSLEILNLSGNDFITLPATIGQLSKLETLKIERCQRLQDLPELPSSLNRLFAQNCNTLIRLSCPSLTKSTSRLFDLRYCLRLTEKQGSNNVPFFNSFLQSLLKSQLQGLECTATSSGFDIVIPGHDIPEWFTYKSRRCKISAILPTPFSGNLFRGLALCALFPINSLASFDEVDNPGCETVDFQCILRTEHNHKAGPFSVSFNAISLDSSEHLWLCYISKRYFSDSFLQDSGYIKATFTCFKDKHLDLPTDTTILKRKRDDYHKKLFYVYSIEACGLRPVYSSDIE